MCCLFLFLFLSIFGCNGDKVVWTSVGNIRGYLNNKGYYEYLGIPYGKVSEDNYFGESTPYPIFNTTFDASSPGPACPQGNGGIFIDIEKKGIDCLNLNVFTPLSATNTSKLPTLIWIFGGKFERGSASPKYFGPKYLIRHDVTIVTINHRLGPYGFMCLDVPEVPGNQGLKDQYLAFQWVKNNIEYFGGNPDQVTLFGQSSGGISIDLHLLSERPKLYDKVILESGSSLGISANEKVNREAPLQIAEYLGLSVDGVNDALKQLSKQPTENVVTAALKLKIHFAPCVEKKFEGVQPFITHEWNYAAVPKVEDVPVLIGFNNFEYMAMDLPKSPEYFTKDIFYSQLKKTFNFDDDRLELMENDIQTFYMGDDPVDYEHVWPIIDFHSDYVYIYPMQRSIRKYLESNARNIYYYMFKYSGGRNLAKIIYNVTACGAAHVDEVGYLFDWASIAGPVSDRDQLMIDRMTTMWTNFAKFGDPVPETSTLLPVKWIPLNKQTYNYLEIDYSMKIKQRPYTKRMSYLDLFYRYNRDYEILYGVAD